MIKNMTRKGLALGSVVALAVSGFTGLPANAAGIDNGSVSLAPNGGAEYNTIAGAAFELKSNMATGVVQSGRYLKFLVEDANRDMTVASGQYFGVPTAAVGTGSTDTLAVTIANHAFKVGDKVSLTGVTYNSTGTAAISNFVDGVAGTSAESLTITIAGTFAVGDVITVKEAATADVSYTVTAANLATGTAVNNIAAGLLAAITGAAGALYVDNTSSGAAVNIQTPGNTNPTDVPAVEFTRVNLAALTDVAISAVTTGGSGTITVPSAAAISGNVASGGTYASAKATISTTGNRAANGSFVVDTKDATNTADKVLRLRSVEKNSTQTAVVTAWVDSNDNGLIDTTEYASPARTVSFLASTAITPTVAILPAYVGESTVKAEVTFSPVLNGAQLVEAYNLNGAANALQVLFTRPGSTKSIAAATVEYSNVTKTFTATSVDMNAASGVTATDGTTTGWNIAQPTARTLTSAKIDKNVATVTVNAAHGLQVGDRVLITSATTARLNSPTSGDTPYTVVTSVPSTTTFTFAELNADSTKATGADLVATSQSAGSVAITGTGSKILRNFVVAGQYSAQAQLYQYRVTPASALTNIGSASTASVGATTADTAEFEGVATANSNLAGKVRVGTTAATVVLSVLDEDGDAVGAGVNVSMTAIRQAGSSVITVNGRAVAGTTVNLAGVTDANGQVSVAVTNATGAAGDIVRLTANAQGATTSNFDVTWENAIYSIVDLNDASAVDSPARNRMADANGSYTFDVIALDQFKSPAPATVRLLATVTGRTTMTTPVALTNGRATVAVSPDGSAVTGDTTVQMNFQTQNTTTGLWTSVLATSLDARYVDWDGAGDEKAAVLIKFYSQTDRVTLNANGANLPSSTTAVRTANVTTKALKVVDLRTANDAAETYPTATKAVVSGAVTNSVTGAAKLGGAVTISGAGLLFNVGEVWAQNSVTFIANDGTFAVDVYSRVGGKQTVTVTSGSVSSTAELTFSAVGAVTGYTVNLVTPASAAPGTTFKVEGQVRDVNGNPVVIATAGTGANPTLTLTYNGPGLVNGALPTTTNAAGTFSFFVLLGSNDKGTATVTASYDADGTGTASALVTTSSSITVGDAATTAKVNAGSFKGFVAVYARGYEGKRLSAKIGNDWVIVPALASNFVRVTDFTGAGVSIEVRVFIDRVLVGTFPLVTK